MGLWSRLAALFVGRSYRPSDDDPMAHVRWIPADESPFGIEVLDCRSAAQALKAVVRDRRIVERFQQLRWSDPEEFRGRRPVDPRACPCELRYPHEGPVRDGTSYSAEVMEDKWDVHRLGDHLYFVRSWSGDVEYRARFALRPGEMVVTSVEARRVLAEEEPSYPVAAVDYLIRSHLLGRLAPHPLPRTIAHDHARQLALFSFAQYGRHGLYGTFADTTSLPKRPAGRMEARG